MLDLDAILKIVVNSAGFFAAGFAAGKAVAWVRALRSVA